MADRPRSFYISLLACGISLLASASMWFYVDPILVHHQIVDAAAHSRPRGNLSDLYPRWLGARELLLHGRNPYSPEITVEIQRGYYGRPLNPELPNDPKDQQAFAYPVYVVFLLAPTIKMPFLLVQSCFRWALIGLAVAGVYWWLKALRWKLSFSWKLVCILLLLGSFPEVQGIKLQQLSLLVAALLAAGVACVSAGWLFLGGAILALATIKPQLAWPLVAWLLFWSACQWRTRWRLAGGFAAMMAILLAAAEFVLPGWWKMFVQAIRQYHQYTGNQSVLDELVNWGIGPLGGKILALIAVIASGLLLWNFRGVAASSENFGKASAFVIALSVLIVPMYAPYNQVLLLAAILLLAKEREKLISESRAVRVIYFLTLCALGWAWVASLGLSVVWFFSPTAAMNAIALPLLATFSLPPLVFVLTWLSARQSVLQACDAAR